MKSQLFFLLLIIASYMAGCTTSVKLEVIDGTGSGRYDPGEIVTITANPPSAGFEFDKWTGNLDYIVESRAPDIIKIKIPNKDIRLQANYRDILVTHIYPDAKWYKSKFNEFFSYLSANRLQLLAHSLRIRPKSNWSRKKLIKVIKRRLLKKYYHRATWVAKGKNSIPYHRIVKELATKLKIDKNHIRSESTFMLERRILFKAFENIWGRLSQDEKMALLESYNIAPESSDAASVAKLSGYQALLALQIHAKKNGFNFYRNLSEIIFQIGKKLNITFPFSVYTASSRTTALLSGPVGWAITGIGTVYELHSLGKPDIREATGFVAQMYLIKIEALQMSNRPIPDP